MTYINFLYTTDIPFINEDGLFQSNWMFLYLYKFYSKFLCSF